MIPKQLMNEEYKFIKLNGKVPIEKDWNKKNNYSYNSEPLQDWIRRGNNYGIATGYNNILVLDFDDEVFFNSVKDKLPDTFKVKTGSGKEHWYYHCDRVDSFKVLDEEKNTLCDVQGLGKQIVAPGSIHPTTRKKYEVYNDVSITVLSYDLLLEVFKPWFNPVEKEEKIKREIIRREGERNVLLEVEDKISVKDVLDHFGFDSSKNLTQCPFHSSKAGKCFGFKDKVWSCFHCGSKGNIFTLYMMIKKCSFKEALAEMRKW